MAKQGDEASFLHVILLANLHGSSWWTSVVGLGLVEPAVESLLLEANLGVLTMKWAKELRGDSLMLNLARGQPSHEASWCGLGQGWKSEPVRGHPLP